MRTPVLSSFLRSSSSFCYSHRLGKNLSEDGSWRKGKQHGAGKLHLPDTQPDITILLYCSSELCFVLFIIKLNHLAPLLVPPRGPFKRSPPGLRSSGFQVPGGEPSLGGGGGFPLGPRESQYRALIISHTFLGVPFFFRVMGPQTPILKLRGESLGAVRFRVYGQAVRVARPPMQRILDSG